MGGWPDQPYGQCPKGPIAPSFDCLSSNDKKICVNATHTLFAIDILPPSLQPGGRLHEMLLACGAALLMYYPQRHRDGQLPELLAKMRDAYGREKNGVTTRSATMTRVNHENMQRWSMLIKNNFDRDNLHLTTLSNFEEKVDRSRSFSV